MNILVIGDVILDINYFSNINRMAPEANVPIYNICDTTYNLGGAANVSKNLKLLNTNVTMVSVLGNDFYSEKIRELFNNNEIKFKFFHDNKRRTTQKHRIINKNSIVVRYDIEDNNDIDIELSNEIIKFVKEQKELNSIVISDYDKGIVTEYLCQEIIKHSNSNNIYTFVDPKINNLLKYRNCFCFKPNLQEAKTLSNTSNICKMFENIKEKLNNVHTVITANVDGLYIDSVDCHIKHDNEINLVDVTGAGDVVMSLLTYCFIKYKDIKIAGIISNYIARKSLEVIGNYSINLREVEQVYNSLIEFQKNDRIILDGEIDRLKQFQGKNVVFTNGCFDIVHSAHLKLLNFCKTQGEILIVGLNSNESIKKIKGEKRPINDISERCDFLLNLNVVDHVVVFNDDTPYNIINLIKPKTLVKGGDYNSSSVVGSELVENVLIYEYIKNKSSTSVINKILENNNL
jgi:D-beta-D-heptose 7-phosphate kinase/D-beta-D-heptose 1-phosphate adenosyltransferase